MADRCKFEKYQYQVSYDSGSTWENVTPVQVRKGNITEYMSADCSEIETLYRWVDMEGTYICDGNNKYIRQMQEESYDNGVSWYASYPTAYRQGTFVGTDSEYCADKFVGHYIYNESSDCPRYYIWNGETCVLAYDPLKVVKCNDNSTLTSAETKYYSSKYSLVSAEIGSCVTSIDIDAFSGNTSLTSCTIGSGVTSIGASAFRQCRSLTSIDIPNSVTTIGSNVFYQCRSLTSCTIGSGVTSIGLEAFQGCSGLTNITIPNSVTSIGVQAFENCSGLTSCTLSNNITTIEIGTFNRCGLISLDIPYGITTIGCGNCLSSTVTGPFHYCKSLISVNIPNSVRQIGYSSFAGCYSLSSVTIPSSTYYIGAYAFASCTSLTSITVNSTTPPTLGYVKYGSLYLYDSVFSGSTCPIYVPAASVETYKSATGWSTYASRIQAIPT